MPGRWSTQPSSASRTPHPVPGYEAPPERTLGPGTRVGRHLLTLLKQCHDSGHVDRSVLRARQSGLGATTKAQLTSARQALDIDIPVPLFALGLDALVRLHGLTSLEVFGQLRLTVPDGQAYFHEVLDAELRRCGLTVPRLGATNPTLGPRSDCRFCFAPIGSAPSTTSSPTEPRHNSGHVSCVTTSGWRRRCRAR